MNVRNALRSEDTEQIAVMQWAQYNTGRFPELKWLHHIPNGGSRNKAEAVKLRQMGVRAGVSDLCLPYPHGIYHGLYIEMKYGNGRKQDSQKEFLEDMKAAGHFVCTCYSAETAVRVLQEYMELQTDAEMSIENNCTMKEGA
ncbi:MAG: VRR-NUC domain-containing protein [Lachnospiraceae bacterium]|nr:VRR-NUC domain-containing protein [Lachnospiraceae bacterium]